MQKTGIVKKKKYKEKQGSAAYQRSEWGLRRPIYSSLLFTFAPPPKALHSANATVGCSPGGSHGGDGTRAFAVVCGVPEPRSRDRALYKGRVRGRKCAAGLFV